MSIFNDAGYPSVQFGSEPGGSIAAALSQRLVRLTRVLGKGVQQNDFDRLSGPSLAQLEPSLAAESVRRF